MSNKNNDDYKQISEALDKENMYQNSSLETPNNVSEKDIASLDTQDLATLLEMSQGFGLNDEIQDLLEQNEINQHNEPIIDIISDEEIAAAKQQQKIDSVKTYIAQHKQAIIAYLQREKLAKECAVFTDPYLKASPEYAHLFEEILDSSQIYGPILPHEIIVYLRKEQKKQLTQARLSFSINVMKKMSNS